jgi:zinc protease
MRTLTQIDTLKAATSLFARLISQPDFPRDAFLREKNQQLMAITQETEIPDVLALQTFYRILYGHHPYAHAINGNPQTVNAIQLDDIKRFYQRYIISQNATIVMVGAINSGRAHELAEQIAERLSTGKKAPPIEYARPLINEISVDVPYPGTQTIVRLGEPGITHQDPDYFPLQIGSYILGGGSLVSRLANELREKRGLTYGVYSQFSPMPGLGPFVIAFSTKNKQTRSSIEITRDILKRYTESGPTDAELIAAKQYLTGSFPLSLASNRSIAEMLLRITFYGLPDDFLNTYVDRINAVTTRDIQQALQRHIHPEHLLQVTVGRL